MNLQVARNLVEMEKQLLLKLVMMVISITWTVVRARAPSKMDGSAREIPFKLQYALQHAEMLSSSVRRFVTPETICVLRIAVLLRQAIFVVERQTIHRPRHVSQFVKMGSKLRKRVVI